MLREILRPRPKSRSKLLVKQRNIDNWNFLSEHSTNPVSYVQNSFMTNSKRGVDTNYPQGSLKPNANVTNQNSSNNNNVVTESFFLPSSTSQKEQMMQSVLPISSNSVALEYNANIKMNRAFSGMNNRIDSHRRNDSTKKSKDEPLKENSINSHLSPLAASKCRSSSHSINRLQTLESCISLIKHNVYEKSRPIITSKSRIKDQLRTNVGILTSNVRTVYREAKVNGSLTKSILKENDRLVSTGERAVRDTYFMHKEFPSLKSEIDEMKTLIAQHTEETKYIRNDAIQIEREVLLVKDSIQHTNGQIASLLKQREKLGNALMVIHKHISTAKEKIDNRTRASDELMNSVYALVDHSIHVLDYVKL